MNKKILWILLLIIFIIAIIIIATFVKPRDTSNTATVQRGDGSSISQAEDNQEQSNEENTTAENEQSNRSIYKKSIG